MAYLRRKYYSRDEDIPNGLKALYAGYEILREHPLFSQLRGTISAKTSHLGEKNSIACVTKSGDIYVNISANLNPQEWAYVLAHGLLHLAFGHFDKGKMPADETIHSSVWNKACDIFIARFLADIGFGASIFPDPATEYKIKLNDEKKIYNYLIQAEGTEPAQTYGCNSETYTDMIGVSAPIVYKNGFKNEYVQEFSNAITHSIKKAVSDVGGHDLSKKKDTVVTRAAAWFLAHYPLLGIGTRKRIVSAKYFSVVTL